MSDGKCPMFDGSVFDMFYHQIFAYLQQNASGIVRFFKMYEIWVSWKNRWVFPTKNVDFFKIVIWGKFAVKGVSNDNVL